MKKLWLLIFCLTGGFLYAQDIALLKYDGGGDWYANPTSLPNLAAFCNENIGTAIGKKPPTVETNSPDIFSYPFLHMTGHGNVFFSDEGAENLRNYLISGGFLHIDDNYGMDQYIRKALKNVFPNQELKEIPASHPIFSSAFEFKNGLPKIHEHDGKRPQAFGIWHENRLILLYTYESDLSDGWENEEVHHDPIEVRLKALKMGANIIKYVFDH